ncbi:MAG TPA: SpoIIE family protein phosphatase [Terriglobales bacterium]|nr:SpoIIE family protein phosphatase [Terriglobales bacterium]
MPAPFHLDRQSLRVGERFAADTAELIDASLAAVSYARRTGGQFYDFLRVGATRVLFALIDFGDAGDENAEITEATQTTFRQVGTRVFREPELNFAEAMIELSLELNRALLETAQARSSPAFVGCYEESLGTTWYVNAGPTTALVRDPTGVVELPATGLSLGLFSHATCDASPVALMPGAALLAVSHGVVEGNSPGREPGLEALKAALRETAAANAKDLCMAILARVEELTDRPPDSRQGTALALVRSREVSRTGP